MSRHALSAPDPWRVSDRGLLEAILFNQGIIMSALDDLNAAVAAETSVNQSVVTLLGSLADQLSAAHAADDSAGIVAVVATMKSNAAALSAAVTANTPAAPAPADLAPAPVADAPVSSAAAPAPVDPTVVTDGATVSGS